MANKAGQFYNALTQQWSQWPAGGLTTADITLANGRVCTIFNTIKDSQDNMYIVACPTDDNNNILFIKLTKDGIKTRVESNRSSFITGGAFNLVLSRDQQYLYMRNYEGVPSSQVAITRYKTDFSDVNQTNEQVRSDGKFAIYKDIYIWVASGNTVTIYDYTTKAELASSPGGAFSVMCCNTENELYSIWGNSLYTYIEKFVYDSSAITKQSYSIAYISASSIKQLLIDPFGDLIILTNNNATSTLLKYTTAGVQIGAAITLANPSYNLAIHQDGSLRYETALATYKVPNTAGQAIPAVGSHILWRGTGNTGYSSNRTGYQPSVYA